MICSYLSQAPATESSELGEAPFISVAEGINYAAAKSWLRPWNLLQHVNVVPLSFSVHQLWKRELSYSWRILNNTYYSWAVSSQVLITILQKKLLRIFYNSQRRSLNSPQKAVKEETSLFFWKFLCLPLPYHLLYLYTLVILTYTCKIYRHHYKYRCHHADCPHTSLLPNHLLLNYILFLLYHLFFINHFFIELIQRFWVRIG